MARCARHAIHYSRSRWLSEFILPNSEFLRGFCSARAMCFSVIRSPLRIRQGYQGNRNTSLFHLCVSELTLSGKDIGYPNSLENSVLAGKLLFRFFLEIILKTRIKKKTILNRLLEAERNSCCF